MISLPIWLFTLIIVLAVPFTLFLLIIIIMAIVNLMFMLTDKIGGNKNE